MAEILVNMMMGKRTPVPGPVQGPPGLVCAGRGHLECQVLVHLFSCERDQREVTLRKVSHAFCGFTAGALLTVVLGPCHAWESGRQCVHQQQPRC